VDSFATSRSKARRRRQGALADRLGARLDATMVLDEGDNPFLADFYAAARRRVPGAAVLHARAAPPADALRQSDLFSQVTVCDYLFERDKIYAYLNLDDNELFIYQRLYELLAQDVPSPDLVIYLQTPTDVLRRRLQDARAPTRRAGARRRVRARAERGLQPLLLHYNATPLLVVETSQFDLTWGDEALDDFMKQLHGMGKARDTTSRARVIDSERWRGSRRSASRFSPWPRTSRAGCPRGCGSSARPAARSSTTRISSPR
jgi:deoxyadenosine/deoxycytidine kinase